MIAEDKMQGISSFVCGRESVECRNTAKEYMREGARGEIKVFKEWERGVVSREKNEEFVHFFKKVSYVTKWTSR